MLPIDITFDTGEETERGQDNIVKLTEIILMGLLDEGTSSRLSSNSCRYFSYSGN